MQQGIARDGAAAKWFMNHLSLEKICVQRTDCDGVEACTERLKLYIGLWLYLEKVTGQVCLSKSQRAATRANPDSLHGRNLYRAPT